MKIAHKVITGFIIALGLLHLGFTFHDYDHLSLNAVWFASAGIAMILAGFRPHDPCGHRANLCGGRTNADSDDLADEVVFVGFGDTHVVDRADLRIEVFRNVVDEDVAVDLLGLAFEAALE